MSPVVPLGTMTEGRHPTAMAVLRAGPLWTATVAHQEAAARPGTFVTVTAWRGTGHHVITGTGVLIGTVVLAETGTGRETGTGSATGTGTSGRGRCHQAAGGCAGVGCAWDRGCCTVGYVAGQACWEVYCLICNSNGLLRVAVTEQLG